MEDETPTGAEAQDVYQRLAAGQARSFDDLAAKSEDYAAAMLVEATIKRGEWPHGPPRLNPARR